MKKNLIVLGAVLAASITLTNCTKENQQPAQPEAENTPFVLYASQADTKTVNDGFSTKWAAGDDLSVYTVRAGEIWYDANKNCKFVLTDIAANKFESTGDVELSLHSSNDWCVLYPYSEAGYPHDAGIYQIIGSKAGEAQKQIGNGSMAHIAGPNCPMLGFGLGIAKEEPVKVEMEHLTSLVEVVVKNTSNEPLTVSNISLTAPKNIVGRYKIKTMSWEPDPSYAIIDREPVYNEEYSSASELSNVAALAVEKGEPILAGGSAKFYLAIKPFEAKQGDELALVVNDRGKKITLNSSVKFERGKIKTLNFVYEPIIINIDGDFADWENVGTEAVTTSSDKLLQRMKVHVDDNNVNIYAEFLASKIDLNSTSLYIYTDHDNNPDTGCTTWQFGNARFGYYMTGGLADGDINLNRYEWSGTDGTDLWAGTRTELTPMASVTGNIVSGETLVKYECAIPRAAFKDLSSTLKIGFCIYTYPGGVETADYLPRGGQLLSVKVPAVE